MSNVVSLSARVRQPVLSYFRLCNNDHTVVSQLISEGASDISGIIFDARFRNAQIGLVQEANHAGIETVLDGRFLELSTEAGGSSSHQALEWVNGDGQLTRFHFSGRAFHSRLERFAECASNGFGALIAPGRYVETPNDPWFQLDRSCALQLREILHRNGNYHTRLYYPLSIPMQALKDRETVEAFAESLSTFPVEGILLKVHPFGTNFGRMNLRSYIEAAHIFNRQGLALIGDRVGPMGVPFAAFGALGGFVSGVTYGDSFDYRRMNRPPDQASSQGFSPKAGVYVGGLGGRFKEGVVDRLFENGRIRGALGCKDPSCCRGGWRDMLRDPRRHGLLETLRQRDLIAQVPTEHRHTEYLTNTMRSQSMTIGRLLQSRLDDDVRSVLEAQRNRIDNRMATLEDISNRLGAIPLPNLPGRLGSSAAGQR